MDVASTGDRLSNEWVWPAQEAQSDIATAIVAAIEEDILLGQLRPRERLIEEGLGKRFGVNRAIIRRALADLGNRGLVQHEPFRGAKVRDYTLDEIREICEFREVLLKHATMTMALPIESHALAAIREAKQAHSFAVEVRDVREIYRSNARFHSLIFALCGNTRIAKTLDHLSYLTMIIRAYRVLDFQSMQRARDAHNAMVTALEAIDRDGFLALSLRHMARPEDIFRSIRDWVDED